MLGLERGELLALASIMTVPPEGGQQPCLGLVLPYVRSGAVSALHSFSSFFFSSRNDSVFAEPYLLKLGTAKFSFALSIGGSWAGLSKPLGRGFSLVPFEFWYGFTISNNAYLCFLGRYSEKQATYITEMYWTDN